MPYSRRRNEVRFGSKAEKLDVSIGCPLYPQKRRSSDATGMSALCQQRTFPLSAPQRALRDDVDHLERHHYFAGLIDYLDERGDRAAIGL